MLGSRTRLAGLSRHKSWNDMLARIAANLYITTNYVKYPKLIYGSFVHYRSLRVELP